jgi:hypothetical protein
MIQNPLSHSVYKERRNVYIVWEQRAEKNIFNYEKSSARRIGEYCNEESDNLYSSA